MAGNSMLCVSAWLNTIIFSILGVIYYNFSMYTVLSNVGGLEVHMQLLQLLTLIAIGGIEGISLTLALDGIATHCAPTVQSIQSLE